MLCRPLYQRTLNTHQALLHTSRNRSYAAKEFKCTWKNCHSSFNRIGQFEDHMNIHTNNLFKCSFCPYTAAKSFKLVKHYRYHYKVYDYKCEICGKLFVSNEDVLRHSKEAHYYEMADCPLCGRHGRQELIKSHLNKKHKVFCKWNKETKKFIVYKRYKVC